MTNCLKSFPATLLIIGSLLSCFMLQAQSIRINMNQKVIYSDSLNLPPQTSINSVLTMMSELLQRPGAVIYSNYDIQVNGMSVSDVSEVALYQLDLQDVEQIVISESPTSSYLKNGQGGSINLMLRQKDNNDDGYWGSAGLDVSHPSAVGPQLHLGYRTKKFYLSALALSDIYHGSSVSEELSFENGKFEEINISQYEEHYRSQLANVMMEYVPTKKDKIKLNLSESYMYDKETTALSYDTDATILSKMRNTSLKATTSYSHSFKQSNLGVEAQFGYTPSVQKYLTPFAQDLDADLDRYNVSGMVQYNASLLKPTRTNQVKVGVGTSFNYTFGDEDIDYRKLDIEGAPLNTIETHNHTSFVQPFAYAEAMLGKFRMKVQSEYQVYRYDIFERENEFTGTNRDFTGQVIVEWHLHPSHALRLVGVRALQRPSESQMYPFMVYNPSASNYVKGNEELTPARTKEARLDYIADLRWGDHKLHYDVNVSYKDVDDMIEQYTEMGSNSSDGLGASLPYLSYVNHGENDILSGNVMALYSYKVFSVSLTGNIYHNKQVMLTGDNHYTYYNVSLNPHFNLKDGWQGSFGLTYNSSVDTEYATLGDCTQVSTLIGRRWRNFYVYAFTRQALKKHVVDVSNSDEVRFEHWYELVPNMSAIGVKYLF